MSSRRGMLQCGFVLAGLSCGLTEAEISAEDVGENHQKDMC